MKLRCVCPAGAFAGIALDFVIAYIIVGFSEGRCFPEWSRNFFTKVYVMHSSTYISTSFVSAETIAEDILSAMPQAAAIDGQVGFLFCDSQTDYATVLAALAKRVSFPIVGGTALGFPFSGEDEREISAALMVVRKEGLTVSVIVSDPLVQDRHQEQMRSVFERCRDALGEAPKLILPFFPLMPGLATGLFINDVFDLAKDVPVFGGTTTNDCISTRPAIFAEGAAYGDRMALVMLGGAVAPVFATSNLVSPTVEYAPTVTQSEENVVLRVDDASFCDYMRTIGISPEDRINGVDALMQYGPTPVIMHNAKAPETDVPEVRCISFTDIGKGSATFSGPVPEGTRLRMSILRKQDVDTSVEDCLEKLQRRMKAGEEKGYQYSALFCISCVARYFVLAGGPNTERELLMRGKPEGLAPIGFYAFCEIGPVYASSDGRQINRSHSASVAMCAI